MHVDYTKLFDTPDELVNFLMKSHKEQSEILAELVTKKEMTDVVMTCKIPGRENADYMK